MSIVQSIQRNTVTLTAGLTFVDITLGIPIIDINRAELVIDVRAGQSTVNLTNMCITGRITSSTNVRIERGGNVGAMVVHFHVVEYTVASGILVDRGSDILNATTKNIPLTSRDRNKCYSRLFMKTSSNSSYQAIMMTHDVSSDTNLQIIGDAVDTSISFDWQRIYIPDATVHHFSGLATGNSYNVDITGLGIVPDESFCVVSMRYGGASGIDSDEFKGANLISNTVCNIYSHFADSHNFTLQIVHRPGNRVERNYDQFSTISFDVDWIDPVVWDESYINLCAPYGYFCTDEYSNNAADFMNLSQLNGDFSITINKFRGGVLSKVVSEVIYLDGGSVSSKKFKAPYWIFNTRGK